MAPGTLYTFTDVLPVTAALPRLAPVAAAAQGAPGLGQTGRVGRVAARTGNFVAVRGVHTLPLQGLLRVAQGA